MALLRRFLRLIGCDVARLARAEERARCATMALAMAERWNLVGVPEIADEFRDLSERMRCGR
jgi:hypothetical protein